MDVLEQILQYDFGVRQPIIERAGPVTLLLWDAPHFHVTFTVGANGNPAGFSVVMVGDPSDDYLLLEGSLERAEQVIGVCNFVKGMLA